MIKKFPYRFWVRNGLVWKLKEIRELENIAPRENYVVTIRTINLEILLKALLVTLLLGLFIYIITMRYLACMEIFDNAWYCATR